MPTLSEAVAGDDEVEVYSTLLQILARHFDECESKRDVAALAIKITDAQEKLTEARKRARKAGKGSKLNELERKRAERAGRVSGAV